MMAQLYYEAIKEGYRTFEQVPALWKEQVRALLDADPDWTWD